MRGAPWMAALALAIASDVSAQAPSKSPTVGACLLITKEDASAALGGEAVTGPNATTMPNGPSSCEYSGAGIHVVNLVTRPMDAATAAVYKAICAKKTHDGLTDLGDTSCWYSDKHEELQVVKGGTFFSVKLRGGGDPTEPIKALARKVYGRVK